MFLRRYHRTKHGKTHTYYALVESVRTEAGFDDVHDGVPPELQAIGTTAKLMSPRHDVIAARRTVANMRWSSARR